MAVGPAAPRTPTTARVMHVYCPWWGPTRPVGGGEEKRRSGHEATPPPKKLAATAWLGHAAGPGSCCPAAVAMMEAADHGRRDDLAPVGRLHPSGFRGVLVEGQMSPGRVVIGEIRVQHAAQVGVVGTTT